MAAFVTLTDGTYTFRLTNVAGGETYGDNFFSPGIQSLTNPKFSGDDYVRMRDCTLKVKYSIKDITGVYAINDVWSSKAKRQLSCTMVMWDGTTAITYSNLKAVRFGKGQTYTYQIVSEKMTADLLTAAPDVKATGTDPDTYADKRYYPRVFGSVKHVKPFLLVKDVLKYWSGGELYECYSRGQTQTVTKSADSTFTASTAIVEPFTMDVSAGTQTAETLTRKIVRPENFVFYQATAPTTATYLLTEGMEWVDTSDASGLKKYRWSGSAWVSIRDGRVESGLNDSGEIVKIVKGTNLPTTGMVNGLNATQNFFGYYNSTGTSWDAYIDKEGGFYFGDGGGTIGTNYFLSFYNLTNGIGGGGTPDTFVISTPQFKVDASGNATFSGTLSAADGTFTGIGLFKDTTGTPTYMTIVGGVLKSTSFSTRDPSNTDVDTTTQYQMACYTYDSGTSAWLETFKVDSYSGIYINEVYAGSRGFNVSGGKPIGLNTAFGINALNVTAPGRYNTAIGENSLISIAWPGGASSDGWYNTAIGYSSGDSITTGARNTALGFLALADGTSGYNNICIGAYAGLSTSPFNITTESNRIVLGDNNITNAYIKVAWTVTSDKRDKADIIPLRTGIDFIMGLNPIEFKWDDRSRYPSLKPDGSKKDSNITLGFLAQDVAELEDKFGFENDVVANTEKDDKYLLKETALIPFLVKAIQEQQESIDKLIGICNILQKKEII